MKYSQLAGVVFASIIVALCFMPWVVIEEKIIVSGLKANGTSFGKPGLMNIILSSVCIILFIVPKVLAKRFNVFIAAINLAWSLRNYLVLTTCMMGVCPEKKAALYLLVLVSIAMQFSTFFPNIPVEEKK
jgi:hypothetical protein